MTRWLASVALLLLTLFLALPVLALVASWLGFDAAAQDVLWQMAQTVLPGYTATTVGLCVAVGLGVALVGMGTASAVTLFDFPGRRTLEWALLLPLAMPAYVVAYAYTDFLQFSGPLQSALRETFGLRGRVFPEVRSLGGAVWVFTFSLYPYVYLLARTALSERAAQLMEAARLLGAPLLMKALSVAGTVAMFLVGGGILTHGIPALHHLIEDVAARAGGWWEAVLPTLLDGVCGVLAGALALVVLTVGRKLFGRPAAAA